MKLFLNLANLFKAINLIVFMQELKLLNNKDVKHIKKRIKDIWDSDIETDYGYLLSEKDKLFIVNKEVAKIEWKNLRLSSIGITIGTYEEKGFRLNVEGSQLIGKHAKKNIVELDEDQIKRWLLGNDLDIDDELRVQIDKKIKDDKLDVKEFLLIENNGDFYGTGRIKDDKILSFLSKSRKLVDVI